MAKHDDSYYVTKAPLTQALIHLAIPMMIATSAGVIYNIVNAGIIGHLHSTLLLAAITFGLPLTAVVLAIGGLFGTGGSSIIGRLAGQADVAETPEEKEALLSKAKDYSSFTVWTAMIFSVIIAILGVIFIHPLVTLLGASGEAVGPTVTFARINMIGTPILVLAFVLEQLVRVEGATKVCMRALVISNVVNFLLDLLFILHFNWGVAGAAWAVITANLISSGILIHHIKKSKTTALSLSISRFKVDTEKMKEVFGIGFSEVMMSAFILITSLLFNHVVTTYGDAPLAAFGIVQRIVQFPETLAMGVAMGLMPLIASATGRGDKHRIRESLFHGSMWIVVLVGIFIVPLLILGRHVLTPFSTDDAVLKVATVALVAQLISALFNGITNLAVTYCQSAGKAKAAGVLSTIQGVMFIPALFLGKYLFGLNGIVWAMTVAEGLCFLAALALLVPIIISPPIVAEDASLEPMTA